MTRFILERVLILAIEMIDITSRPLEIWDSQPAHATAHSVFNIWEPPPSRFFKVNFNDSVRSSSDGANFLIYDYASRVVATEGSHLIVLFVPTVKLQTVWARITYVYRSLHIDHLFIEGDSATVMTWLQRCM